MSGQAVGGPRVANLPRNEVPDAARVIAAGHAEYPSFRDLFHNPIRRRRALVRFFEATLRDAVRHGDVVGAWDGDGLQGVAVWLPPMAYPWKPGRKARAVPALARVLAADPLAFPRFVRYGAALERDHPAEPHWYLEALSVRPAAQRRGLGACLLAPSLRRADSEGRPCYVETADEANVQYYERFGFSLLRTFTPVPGAPQVMGLWRQHQEAER